MDFVRNYMHALQESLAAVDSRAVDLMASLIATVRDQGGTLFVIGNGGGATHATHACCDFRNLCRVRCMTPWDNVAEMTAMINDAVDGWRDCYADWLSWHNDPSKCHALLVISVGGGDKTREISINLVRAIDKAKDLGFAVLAIVGRDGGHAAKHAHCSVVIASDPSLTTPIVESVQCAVLHALAVHPALMKKQPKWERTT